MTTVIGDGEESGWISMTDLSEKQRKLVEDIHRESIADKFKPRHSDAVKEVEPWFPPKWQPALTENQYKSVTEQYAESMLGHEIAGCGCASAGKISVACSKHSFPANEPGNTIPWAPPVTAQDSYPEWTPEEAKRLLDKDVDLQKKLEPRIKAIQGVAYDKPSATATSPKTLDSSHKVPVNLCPASAIIAIAIVIAQGHKKPGRTIYNWRSQPISYSQYLGAAMRHILKSNDGSDNDPELSQLAGVPIRHDWAAMSCLAIIEDARQAGTLVDDRPVKGGAETFMESLMVKK